LFLLLLFGAVVTIVVLFEGQRQLPIKLFKSTHITKTKINENKIQIVPLLKNVSLVLKNLVSKVNVTFVSTFFHLKRLSLLSLRVVFP
jgi:hypothetical protein